MLTRSIVLLRQKRLPEAAAWIAVDALEAGDSESARRAVQTALNATIQQELEANALYYLEAPYVRLGSVLLKKGWTAEGRAAFYKALRHYHRMPRSLEYLEPWNELEKDYLAKGDFTRFFPVYNLVCSHSLGSNRDLIAAIQAKEPALIDYANLAGLYHNKPPAYVAQLLPPGETSARAPELRAAFALVRMRTRLKTGDKVGAITEAQRLAAALPDRLESLALVTEAEEGRSAAEFVQGLGGEARWTIINFAELNAAPTEYGAAPPVVHEPSGAATLTEIGAAEMRWESDRPVRRLYLVAAGSEFLDIYPIVLATIDGGEVWPLYLDHAEPTVWSFGGELVAGAHTLRLEFLNDAREALRGKVFDRDAHLFRLALEHP